MVLKDTELDSLWRVLGTHRDETRSHIEAAIQEEQTAFTHVTERLFREHRDLLADHEKLQQAFKSLRESYRDPKEELLVFEKELSHLVSDTASFNLDRQSIANRVLDIRNKLRNKLYTLGFKGHF